MANIVAKGFLALKLRLDHGETGTVYTSQPLWSILESKEIMLKVDDMFLIY